MYCPNCASLIEGVKFCRNCGANVSLVEQAMTGELADERAGGRNVKKHSRDRPGLNPHRLDNEPNLAGGIQLAIMGLGFMLVSVLTKEFAPAGRLWWYWLLIPAFAMLGKGIAEIVRARQAEKSLTSGSGTPQIQEPSRHTNELPAQSQPAQIKSAGSIVEGTTRHLDPAGKQTEREN